MNERRLWFKAKTYGWGWTPVSWQGWLVVLISIAIVLLGGYVGQTDDAPGATFLGILLATGLILYTGFKKGERPRWRWGEKK